jgi:hypothetical protein
MNPDASETSETPQPVVTGGILPGMAAISMFLLLVTMLNAFAALRGIFGTGTAKYGIFGVCTLLVVGVFGFLRLRRWGWALVTAGCLVMSIGDLYLFGHNHVGFFIVRALLELCFFLYLVRTQVRERLRR